MTRNIAAVAPMDYPFTEAEFAQAARDWGCNCGPSALAFALKIPLAEVRGAIPEFERKGYTSPTMMKAALDALGVAWTAHKPPSPQEMHVVNRVCLVRVQWTGPWTALGANPRWAYGATHWVCSYWFDGHPCVFDCNGGTVPLNSWRHSTVPFILSHIKRSNGGWFVTHLWSIESVSPAAGATL